MTCGEILADGTACTAACLNGGACAACLGRRSAKAKATQKISRRRESCSLRDVPALLAELERALLLVEDGGGNKVAKAGAITRIIQCAHDIVKADTEKNAERLARLLAENPQLAQRLKAV